MLGSTRKRCTRTAREKTYQLRQRDLTNSLPGGDALLESLGTTVLSYEGTKGPSAPERRHTPPQQCHCLWDTEDRCRQGFSIAGPPPCPSSAPVRQQGMTHDSRDAMRAPLITPLTYAGSCLYWPLPRLPLSYDCERET